MKIKKEYIPLYGIFLKDPKFKNDIEFLLYLFIQLMSMVYFGIFIVYILHLFNINLE